MDSGMRRRHSPGGVAPFGHPRILVRNNSPWHFAVYYVLLRLLVPRYPPCALSSFTNVSGVFRSSRTELLTPRQNIGVDTDFNIQFSGYGTEIYSLPAGFWAFALSESPILSDDSDCGRLCI